jgi:UDP:flavonoid glycosyltransferase YjiC (YdhE family)
MTSPGIVLATVGSLGDLHPFIATGLALKARGARPILAVPHDHVDKCRAAGLEAEAIVPPFAELGRATGLDDDAAIRRIIEDGDFLVRQILLAPLAESTTRLIRIAAGAQAIVGSLFAFAAPIAAERNGIPFIAAALQPMSWFSPLDPPAGPEFRAFARPPLGRLGARWNRFVLALARLEMRRRYAAQIDAVRTTNGLAKSRRAPLIQPGATPALSLGLYSPVLAPLPADAPTTARVTGFPWFDSVDGTPSRLEPEIEAFLAAGPAPLIVSLGSFVPFAAADFYRQAADIARRLGLRAILLTREPAIAASPDILVTPYAPHSLLFLHAAAILHHGGVGTTGQALRAGRPQLVVPFMSDQFDHAARIVRLGVGLTTTPRSFAAEGAGLLRRLLDTPRFAMHAAAAAATIAAEDGAATAADAILALVATPRAEPSPPTVVTPA